MTDPFEDEVLAFFAVDGPIDTRDEAALRAEVVRLKARVAALKGAGRAHLATLPRCTLTHGREVVLATDRMRMGGHCCDGCALPTDERLPWADTATALEELLRPEETS